MKSASQDIKASGKEVFKRINFRWLVVSVASSVLLAMAAWTIAANRTTTPIDTSAEAGFGRDMIAHHAQAVNMAFIVRDNTTNTAVRTVAYDIINTQSVQEGMISGWLQQWGLPQTTTRQPMSWIQADKMTQIHNQMGTNMSQMNGSIMPGMATEADIQKLRDVRGKDAEVLFLQLMIRHHRGGIQMAQAVLDLTKREEVRTLAQTIVNGQKAEIEAMQKLLQDRGANE